MFGHCCFNKGDVKCTMGTGSFIDVNTGAVPHFSIAGFVLHFTFVFFYGYHYYIYIIILYYYIFCFEPCQVGHC